MEKRKLAVRMRGATASGALQIHERSPQADARTVVSENLGRKVAFSPRGAADAVDSSRTTIYEALKRGDLVARKLGRRTIILSSDLRRWLEGLPPYRPP